MATDGQQQVGSRFETPTSRTKATMWTGTANSWTDLHNPNYVETGAEGVGGGQQVGYGVFPNLTFHAVLWHGTAQSAVDLHPGAKYRVSTAKDTDGSQQVGWAEQVSGGGGQHAALWAGSAESFVDLRPEGGPFVQSIAYGVSGGQQVGYFAADGNTRSSVWFGTPESMIDLLGDRPVATSGGGRTQRMGYRRSARPGVGIPPEEHSVHYTLRPGVEPRNHGDLHQFLPLQYQGGFGSDATSAARGIDEFGNIVGYARDLSDGHFKAILWRPVPEPSAFVALCFGILIMFGLRKPRRKAPTEFCSSRWVR